MKRYYILISATALLIVGSSLTGKKKESVQLDTQPVQIDTAQIVSSKTPTFDDFIDAVIFVESSGNDRAYNEQENAVGCLQIRPIMVREVNRLLRKAKSPIRYTLEDRWDREKSIEMFTIIAEEIPCDGEHSFMECMEVIARNWNGGGRGHLKESTLTYWNRVKYKINLDSK